jgi:hypothetical protein
MSDTAGSNADTASSSAGAAGAVGNIAVIVFLSLWMTGWTVGGTFAFSAFLGRGPEVSGAIVWMVLTGAFMYQCVTYGTHNPEVIVWLGIWLCLGIWAAFSYLSCSKRLRDRAEDCFTHWSRLIEVSILRARYALASWTRVQTTDASDSSPMCMLTLSVYLPSGEEILPEAKLLSHDYIRSLHELVRAQLKLRNIEQDCQLILDDTTLADADRLCHCGIVDGTSILAVVVNEEEPEPVAEETEAKRSQTPPLAARCFLALWLCGWVAGEVSVACTLQSMLLGLHMDLHSTNPGA